LRAATPEPAFVDAAARAWCDGNPPPPLSDVSQIAGGQERFVPSERVRRIGRLAGRGELDLPDGDAPARAEHHLLRQQFRAAAQGYGGVVRSGHDDEPAWSGLR
jgi:hypothetical protein